MKRLSLCLASGTALRLASATALSVLVASAAWATPVDFQNPVSFQKSVSSLTEVPLKAAPAPDVEAARVEDAVREANRVPGPYRFALKTAVDYRPGLDGQWSELDDGSKLWRLRITSPGALSLILTMDRFELAEGAKLWVYSPDGSDILGPYSRLDAQKGRLWTPILRGDVAVVELYEPAGTLGRSEVNITQLSHGYRGFFDAEKQGSCNIDTICTEADGWRDQVRSIVMYTLSGIDRCSGVMINNTAQDGRPLLLTAEHCAFGGSTFPDMTVYFNYESPTCGALSGGVRDQSINGGTLLAIDEVSDFALLELSSSPPAEFDVFYSGWDLSDDPMPNGVVAIHHPSVDEKAISYENDQVIESADNDFWPSTHWKINDWDLGTTEGGSSGSPIFDQDNQLVVGTLSGGFAACGNNEADWYGKMIEHANRGLLTHIDPLGTGQTTLDGINADGSSCVESPTVRCLNNNRFAVSITWRDFEDNTGDGTIVEDSNDSSLWWFFSPSNWEALVKVLDGCGFNDRYWVFLAAVTNVEFTLTVTDTQTDITKTYTNTLGVSAPAVTDTDAFATCP